jgi:hypothetical protein
MAKRRIYNPINRKKYNGHYPIVLKSSWEEEFAQKICDLNPACLEWAYEPIKIPYRDPTSASPRFPMGRQTIYIPDFLISYRTPTGRIKTSLIEIKPLHEALQEHARHGKDARQIVRNYAKWEAAIKWCERRNNVEFVILTEAELFAGGDNIKPRKRPVRAYGQRRVKKL